MTRDEFQNCQAFKLILGTYTAPKTPEARQQLQNYLDLLYRALGGWNASQFERVCDQVIKTMARGQRPMPEDFMNAQRALNEAYRAAPGVKHECDSCNGTGWIYANLLSNEGEVKEHAKPCPLCRRGHPYSDAPAKQGWIEAEHSPFKLEATRKTVDFIKRTFENELDWSRSPQEIVNELTAIWKAGQLKTRKTPLGKVFSGLKPLEPQREQATPPPAAAPMVAVVPKAPAEDYEIED